MAVVIKSVKTHMSSTKINSGNVDRTIGYIRCILEIWYKAGVGNKES